MKKVELLAPAGSIEALEAAIMCGADAVYLGGNKFGARAFAANFNDEEMIKAVKYAHQYDVKVYVTVNTLIYDDEVNSFIDYITFLIKTGVDAFIIQDIGMANLLLKVFPNIELHASTQMHIHNIESLNRLKEMGVKRAVIPREYSVEKIKSLKKESDLEFEVFVHGALCVSYSGQCLMSYLIGGRSGNRGECAGSCRLPYKLVEVNDDKERIIDALGKYPLSTKDLYTLDSIDKIIDSGVNSLKIEGRMKRPEYVALVTTLYRKAIDAYYEGTKYQVKEQDLVDLKKMFNRGFTRGHILGDKGKLLMNPLRPNHMGVSIGKVTNISKNKITIKLTDDISIGDGIRVISNKDIGFTITKIYKNNEIVKSANKNDIVSFDFNNTVKIGDEVVKTTDIKLINHIKELYKNNNRKIELVGRFTAHNNQEITFSINDGTNTVTITSDVKASIALNNPTTKDIIIEKINKIGNTPYIFKNIDIDIDDNIFIPLTAINNIKRTAIDKLDDIKINKASNIITNSYDLKVPNVEQDKVLLKAKVRTLDQYQACIDHNVDIIYIESTELYNLVKDNNKVILCLSRVRKNKTNKNDNALVGDIGSVSNNTITDYSLNIANSYSVAFMHSLGATTVTLSYEIGKNNINRIMSNYFNQFNSKPNLEMIVYGRIEAMITEYCPLYTYIDKDNETCGLCKSKKKYYLRDRFNNDYLLTFNNCMMSIYDYKKLNLINDINFLIKSGIKNFRLNFIDESYEEATKVIKTFKEQTKTR